MPKRKRLSHQRPGQVSGDHHSTISDSILYRNLTEQQIRAYCSSLHLEDHNVYLCWTWRAFYRRSKSGQIGNGRVSYTFKVSSKFKCHLTNS
nr:unnamed protein product [Callosobruchus analis]